MEQGKSIGVDGEKVILSNVVLICKGDLTLNIISASTVENPPIPKKENWIIRFFKWLWRFVSKHLGIERLDK